MSNQSNKTIIEWYNFVQFGHGSGNACQYLGSKMPIYVGYPWKVYAKYCSDHIEPNYQFYKILRWILIF